MWEEAMAPHSSTLAWKIPWTEELGRLQAMGLQESDTTERLSTHTHIHTHTQTEGGKLFADSLCTQSAGVYVDSSAWTQLKHTVLSVFLEPPS